MIVAGQQKITTLIEMKSKIILLSIDQCTCHCNNIDQKYLATEKLPNV